jgi:hypothetical protein
LNQFGHEKCWGFQTSLNIYCLSTILGVISWDDSCG